jgi:hypothetical protein
MHLKTIGCGQGGHSCKPNLYLSWLSSIKALGKSDSGERIKLTSMTPGNTEYPKYDQPSVQVSDDALTKVSFVYSTLSAKT